MTNPAFDAEGYNEAIRRHIIQRTLASIRAKGIELYPDILALYEAYAVGKLSWLDFQQLMRGKLADIRAYLSSLPAPGVATPRAQVGSWRGKQLVAP